MNWKALFVALLSFGIVTASAASPQSSNEIVNYNTMQALINSGTFVQTNSSCNFTGLNATTVGMFTSCLANNGSCAGASNSLMPYSAMIACRVLTSTITALADPWLTAAGTYWPTYSGSPAYSSLGSGAPGAPSSALALTSSGSGNAEADQVVSPSTININTHIVVRAYAYSQSEPYVHNVSCGPASTGYATGYAYLEIVNSSGTVEASSSLTDGANSWEQLTVSWTATATGQYRVVLYDVPQTITSSFSTLVRGTCVASSSTTTANGLLTGVTAGNS